MVDAQSLMPRLTEVTWTSKLVIRNSVAMGSLQMDSLFSEPGLLVHISDNYAIWLEEVLLEQ